VNRELAGLEGNDHLARGAQRIEGQHAHVGWAVDQRVLVGAFWDRVEGRAKALRPRFDTLGGELLLEGREHDARGSEIQVLAHFEDDLLQAFAALRFREDLVEVLIDIVWVDSQGERRMRLWIDIDDKDSCAVRSECCRQIDRCGGLPAATLLIHDCDDPHWRSPPRRMTLRHRR
jgi:hypothetical protein